MRRYRFFTADVFTDTLFGGNPLAVLPEADGLDDQEMASLAREFNYSETTFVLPPEDPANTCRVRIFTPSRELPFAGHPTVGTAVLLAQVGRVALAGDRAEVVFEEGVGPVPVRLMAEGGVAVAAELSSPKLPERGPEPPPAAAIAAMLGLDVDDLADNAAPAGWSCGVPFLIVPVRDRSVLGRAAIVTERWQSVLSQWWATEVLVLCRDPERSDSDLRARMFAPAMGIAEDPATGAAAAAVAGHLAQSVATGGTFGWRMEQGFEMGRPSILEIGVDKRGGDVTAVRVGGRAVPVLEGTVSLP